MSTEYDDDMQQARAWLAMDPKEAANRQAELSRRQRQAAKAYGDAAAGQVDAVVFAPANCTRCQSVLTTQTHAGMMICVACRDKANAEAWQNAHRAANHERKLRKAVNGAWEVFAWIVVAICAAATLGWAVGAISWQLGIRW